MSATLNIEHCGSHISAIKRNFFLYLRIHFPSHPKTTKYIILILKDNTFVNKLACSYKLLIEKLFSLV